MTGLQFVDRLHALGLNPAIIMVTSANEGSIVQALLDRGVMDYLVKPFRCERFQQALERFLERKKSLTGGVDQQTIDRLNPPGGGERLPGPGKGTEHRHPGAGAGVLPQLQRPRPDQ